MSSFNQINLMGNLVADPEFKRVGDQDLGKFTLAVNDSYKKEGPPDYIDCEHWNPGKVATFLAKGKSVLVTGRIKQDRWENNEGERRSKLKVVVERLTLVGKKQDSEAPVASAF